MCVSILSIFNVTCYSYSLYFPLLHLHLRPLWKIASWAVLNLIGHKAMVMLEGKRKIDITLLRINRAAVFSQTEGKDT